jgi:hypothetical protein
MGPTLSPVQWVLELFQGGKLSGREVNHSHLLPRLRMSGAVFRLSRFYFYSRQPLCLWLPVIVFNNQSHNLRTTFSSYETFLQVLQSHM